MPGPRQLEWILLTSIMQLLEVCSATVAQLHSILRLQGMTVAGMECILLEGLLQKRELGSSEGIAEALRGFSAVSWTGHVDREAWQSTNFGCRNERLRRGSSLPC
jgi:hypothetical protein